MKKLTCKKGQGSMMLVLMIAGAVGVVASSLMLNMFNLQRASLSLRIRSVTLRAMEEIAQEVKQAYDMGGQLATTCAVDFSTASLLTVNSRFCFRNSATKLIYFNRFTLMRNAGTGVPDYTTTQNIEQEPTFFEPRRMFAGKSLPFLTQAFAYNMAANPHLPAAPTLTVRMDTNTCAAMTTPCIDCDPTTGNANCYKFSVCINGASTCAAPFIIRPIFAFMK